MQQCNDELVEKFNKDSRHFWKVYKTRKRDSCPVSLPEQKEAFQTPYSAQPPSTECLAPTDTCMLTSCRPCPTVFFCKEEGDSIPHEVHSREELLERPLPSYCVLYLPPLV